MAGREAKPTVLKKLEGNPGKRKLNTREPVPGKGIRRSRRGVFMMSAICWFCKRTLDKPSIDV